MLRFERAHEVGDGARHLVPAGRVFGREGVHDFRQARARADQLSDACARLVQRERGLIPELQHHGLAVDHLHDDVGGGLGLVSPQLPLPGESDPPRQVTDNRYVNPYFVYEKPGGSVGLGYVWHEREFPTAGEYAREFPAHPLNDLSGHLRFGPERNHFEVRWMEGMPLAADGGFFTIGGGGRPNGGPTTVFVGLGAGGPYEGAGLALRVGQDIGDFNVGVRTRLGSSGGANASGVGLAIQYSPRATRRH